jgi:biogenesis of lysosome-related organelles complex 1 subunit KXD1
VLELQQKTQARLAKSRARLAQGMADAKKVHEDLEYTTKQMR